MESARARSVIAQQFVPYASARVGFCELKVKPVMVSPFLFQCSDKGMPRLCVLQKALFRRSLSSTQESLLAHDLAGGG